MDQVEARKSPPPVLRLSADHAIRLERLVLPCRQTQHVEEHVVVVLAETRRGAIDVAGSRGEADGGAVQRELAGLGMRDGHHHVPGPEVRLRARQRQRRPPGLADHDGCAARSACLKRMTAEVPPRPRAAEGRDRAVHEPRIAVARLIGREPKGPCLIRVEALDQDVGILEQTAEPQTALRLREGERDATLVAVQEAEEPAALGMRNVPREWTVATGRIALGNRVVVTCATGVVVPKDSTPTARGRRGRGGGRESRDG